MPIKRYKAEQIVTILRQIEVGIANGKLTPQACKEAEITVQTFYRWRKEYGGLKLDQAKRLKELEKENAKLKRVVAELSLEKQVLKDVAEGKPYVTELDLQQSLIPMSLIDHLKRIMPRDGSGTGYDYREFLDSLVNDGTTVSVRETPQKTKEQNGIHGRSVHYL